MNFTEKVVIAEIYRLYHVDYCMNIWLNVPYIWCLIFTEKIDMANGTNKVITVVEIVFNK